MKREFKLILDGQEVLFYHITLEANTAIHLERPYHTVHVEHIDTALAAIEKANRLWVYAKWQEELTLNRITYNGFHVCITRQAANRFYVSVCARRKKGFSGSLTEAAQKKLEELIRNDAIRFYRLHIRDIKQERKTRYVDYCLGQIATSRATLDKLERHLTAKKAILDS